MKLKPRHYLLCVRTEDTADVEPRKIYETLPDERAAEIGYVRVIDESGEDYLYPASLFVALELPKEAERALRAKPKLARRANAAIG